MSEPIAVARERRRVPVLLLALLALQGCEPPSAGWTKPGATGAELRSALIECEGVATNPQPFHFWAMNMSYDSARDQTARLQDQCMVAHGWRPVAEPQPR
ncbi:MAG TPA: hypothetical protein VE397_08755 [Stellaceae bacterium]|nr:hypothetical protein [Stellaceae bacterium]